MNKITNMKKINIYCLFLILIIFSIFQYGIYKICGFTLVPDEFGYWASAAKRIGYNWSDVASLGSYYSFGYSLILMPILMIFQNGVTAYRAAITINMLLMCAGVYVLFYILKKLFSEIDETRGILISGIAVLYPPWIFYMQMTMAEALLNFLFIFIIFLFAGFIHSPKVITAILLALSLVYIYCVHMRTVGVLMACAAVLFLWMICEHPKARIILAFWGMLLVCAVMAFLLKQNTIAEVFSGADVWELAVNDYGSQWNKVRQILTFQEIVPFLKGVAAKIFYLGTATIGIFYWGIGWTVAETVSLIKKLLKKERGKIREWTALFLLLSVLGEILISSIFMYQVRTIDALVYGRYNDFLIPVFLLIGIAVMSRRKWLLCGTLVIGTGTGMLTLMILNIIEEKELGGFRGYMAAGISYFLQKDNFNIYLFFRNTWILMFGAMLFAAFLIKVSGKDKKKAWFLVGILILEILAGLQISRHYTYRVNNANFIDQSIVERIKEQIETAGQVVYLDEGAPPYIDFVQMQLGKIPVKVISEHQVAEAGLEDQRIFCITYIDTGYKEELEKLFDHCLKSNTFYLFYNEKEDP